MPAHRLFRATIMALRRIEPAASGADAWWVQSECDPSREYWVVRLPQWDRYTCNCKDYEQRGGPCKHGLAVELLRAIEARGHEPPGPILFPTRTLADDEPIPFVLTDKALAALDGKSDTSAELSGRGALR